MAREREREREMEMGGERHIHTCLRGMSCSEMSRVVEIRGSSSSSSSSSSLE